MCLLISCCGLQVWNGKGSVLVPFYEQFYLELFSFFYAYTKVHIFSRKMCGHDSLATPNRYREKKILLNRDKYINKHTELRMIDTKTELNL